MLVPSKKLFYAVEAVLFIAYNGKTGPIAGSEVAAQQGLPARYLEPLMQKLVKAGILKGVRGPQGGYILGRERRRISVEGHLRRAARGARAAAVAYRARAKSIDA
ncbi:MAG: Rrf2 family transcriptional regulator [Alphaproteobacteria bacterium]